MFSRVSWLFGVRRGSVYCRGSSLFILARSFTYQPSFLVKVSSFVQFRHQGFRPSIYQHKSFYCVRFC
jgi:hypothetical protein